MLFQIFAELLIRFFIDEPESIRFGSAFLRVVCFAVPLCSVTFLFNAVFQATGQRIKSLVLSCLRKGVLDIPLMGILSLSFGLGATGVVLATPIAELLSTGIAVTMFVLFMRKLEREKTVEENGLTRVSP